MEEGGTVSDTMKNGNIYYKGKVIASASCNGGARAFWGEPKG